MNELEKRVFIRSYKGQTKPGTDQTFEEWMDSIENTIRFCFNDIGSSIRAYGNYHSKFLSRIESLCDEYSEIIQEFHQNSFNKLIDEVRIQNKTLSTFDTPSGRRPIPGVIAEYLLWGLEISMNETGSYELFRIYYHHASQNDFNLNERKKALSSGFNHFGIPEEEKSYDLTKGFNHYFPSVPASTPKDTNWARSLKQTLKKTIENEKR